jgi:hypothetical protein
MIKKICLTFLLFFTLQNNVAQETKTEVKDSTSKWSKVNKVGLDISQISFVNWNAGGNNSISGLLRGHFIRAYVNGNFHWKNELITRYGINKQEGQEVRKTDDQLQLNSTFGYRKDTISNWYYAGKFNFNTQFANGYAYPNTDLAISRPFAPAYVFLGIGAEYSRKDLNLNLYLSPLTNKTTLVFDQRLANQGAFGVDKAIYDSNGDLIKEGKNTRTEVGILITNHKEEIAGTQVIKGPRVQLKQILGVGIEYNF